jgi:hypothetical protein
MWRSDFLRIAAVAICLCSCEQDLFGPDSKEIAGGYRLKRSGSPNQFALTIPSESGGLIIDEIGWRKPFIIARGSGSEYWEVINTLHAHHARMSDRDLKADPDLQSIETKSPESAWKDLDRHDVKYLVKPFSISVLINCVKELLS